MNEAIRSLLALAKGLTDDSRLATDGMVFFAIEGTKTDGNIYAKNAYEKGAYVVSSQQAPEGYGDRWITVDDVRLTRLQMAREFYGDPMSKLQVHGVTGTNGKTTTAYIMEAMLAQSGMPCALLGTICQRIGSEVIPSQLTTPGLIDLYSFAARAVQSGCAHLVMEVSSHALHQGRVEGLEFSSALFSNLTQDHLDYHVDMESYYQAKRLLFTKYLAADGHCVVNSDDLYGARLVQEIMAAQKNVVNVSRSRAQAIEMNADGISITLPYWGSQALQAPLFGTFNVDNLLLALAWANAMGLPQDLVQLALHKVRVPGRFEMAYNDGQKRVIVDYAHTPDALQRVLESARALCRGKLHVVFGCGGDRDRSKRPLMGAIAESLSDVAWVTSDNPRTEDAHAILHDIVNGMSKGSAQVIVDRQQAIRQATAALLDGDWLVVAGKGHEDYQIMGTTKYPFDDRIEVQEAMRLL